MLVCVCVSVSVCGLCVCVCVWVFGYMWVGVEDFCFVGEGFMAWVRRAGISKRGK